MTLRGLARGSAMYSVGFVLPRVGTFLLLPIYVSVLSSADYGAVALVVSVAQLLANLLRMGLDGALMRMHFDSANHEQQQRLLATVATMTTIVAGIGALVAAGLAWAFFEILFSGLTFLPFGLIAAVLSFTITFQYLPATALRAREQPGRFLAFTGGAFLVTAVATLVLLLGFGLGVVGALLGQVAGGVFVVTVSGVMLFRAGGPLLDQRLVRPALRYGLPLVPHTLSGWLLNVSDRWLLSLLLPLSALQARSAIGVYSLGYQLAYAIDLLAQSFNSAWVPFFYRYGGTPQARAIHREMTTLVMAGFGAMAALLAIHAELVVDVIARPEFAPAATIVPILTLAFVAHVFYIAVVTVIFYTKQTGFLPLITGTSAVVNVTTNVALIPVFGIVGAAWATLAAFTFMATATYLLARRAHGTSLDWPRLIVVAAIAGAGSTWATARPAGIDAGRLGVDLLISAALVVVATVLTIGPARRLRVRTREAAAAVTRETVDASSSAAP